MSVEEADDTAAARLLAEALADVDAAWSVGTFGAIAEFARDPDEVARYTADAGVAEISTDRGGLRLDLNERVHLRAYERCPAGADGWSHAIACCLPEDACAMHQRTLVTELGTDHAALRPQDRGGTLFDLGLGTLQADVCVRSSDPGTIELLRAAAGKSLFELPLAARMPELSPHRVVLTRFARAEVYSAIPPPEGTSPTGPHTHLLPKLLASGRTHPVTEPIPQGWVPCAHLFPAHPLHDVNGAFHPFVAQAHRRFQQLLRRYGERSVLAQKDALVAAIRAGALPDTIERKPVDQLGRLVVRQLCWTEPDLPTLEAWRQRYPSANKSASCMPPSHPDET